MKFKEKILKLGKRKNCFIALLLLALLAFSVLGGLNGAKSAKTEVNALSAPQTKNLDLNGIRYTYQTSLSELKNNYGLFNREYDRQGFLINVGPESDVDIQMLSYSNLEDDHVNTLEDFNENLNEISEFVKENITVFNNNVGVQLLTSPSPENVFNSSPVRPILNIDNLDSFNEYSTIKINLTKLFGTSDYNNKPINYIDSCYLTFVYIKTDIDPLQTNNSNYIYENSIFENYAFSKPIDYIFDITPPNGYGLREILCSFEGDDRVEENAIFGRVMSEFINFSSNGMTFNSYIAIDNVNFIDNDSTNIIKYNSYYSLTDTRTINPLFKGNILLSEVNRDNKLIRGMQTSLGPELIFNFDGGAIFGGNFNNNKLINSFKFILDIRDVQNPQIIADLDNNTLFNKNVLFTYNNIMGLSYQYNNYTNQNQLLYLPKIETLKESYEGTEYEALSAQVRDVLYNVNYVGEVEEIEFNEKVEEDFENLLKTTGLGAFIGLVIGLIFGNPLLGAAVGALWGFVVGIFPVIIDGLQAIFGKNAFTGLYNFFKSITEFFANFVDTIINFLISIITNPFVLVLIVIVAVVWVVMYLQKK